MPKNRRVKCGICEASSNRSLICPNCANDTIFQCKRVILESLIQRKQLLAKKLEDHISLKKLAQERNEKLQQKYLTVLEARKHHEDAARRLDEENDRLRHQQAVIAARRKRLGALQSSLKTRELVILRGQVPTLLRYQSLALSHVSAALLSEQRHILRKLFDILPLDFSSIQPSSSSSSVQPTICGLRLPNYVMPLELVLSHPARTSAALGYVVLLLDLLSHYIGGPQLHEGTFQGSTTVLWTQQSFWNRKPVTGLERLPLFLDESLESGGLSSVLPAIFQRVSLPSLSPLSSSHASSTVSSSSTSGGVGGGSNYVKPSDRLMVAAVAAAASAASASASASASRLNSDPDPDPPSRFSSLARLAAGWDELEASGSQGSSRGERRVIDGGGGGGGREERRSTAGPSSNTHPVSTMSSVSYNTVVSRAPVVGSGIHSELEVFAEVQCALDRLQRSVACFVKDRAHELDFVVPEQWGPYGCLVALCAVLRMDERSESIVRL
eukprot:CAMPEP_0175043856 /NCGR_PEP_ID=MMETSP0052_2-20121109/3450_1 /TAXON_ID=51329 ORGANISM="Polytomella parva, Strain SAG 63-3" /NCGR_SAMPLE_ID=MMETSP0052_2 /ASSEMBLY_ACC=CAM_ASM_000194 /LENGTH=497 /DNA_ID=CAMNT_0016307023 /DNA_START=48 /DNA_END=1538 /DNA_ORIENTATION=+